MTETARRAAGDLMHWDKTSQDTWTSQEAINGSPDAVIERIAFDVFKLKLRVSRGYSFFETLDEARAFAESL